MVVQFGLRLVFKVRFGTKRCPESCELVDDADKKLGCSRMQLPRLRDEMVEMWSETVEMCMISTQWMWFVIPDANVREAVGF